MTQISKQDLLKYLDEYPRISKQIKELNEGLRNLISTIEYIKAGSYPTLDTSKIRVLLAYLDDISMESGTDAVNNPYRTTITSLKSGLNKRDDINKSNNEQFDVVKNLVDGAVDNKIHVDYLTPKTQIILTLVQRLVFDLEVYNKYCTLGVSSISLNIKRSLEYKDMVIRQNPMISTCENIFRRTPMVVSDILSDIDEAPQHTTVKTRPPCLSNIGLLLSSRVEIALASTNATKHSLQVISNLDDFVRNRGPLPDKLLTESLSQSAIANRALYTLLKK